MLHFLGLKIGDPLVVNVLGRNIEARISQIGGRFEIGSQFGKGTVISFTIPARPPTEIPPRTAGPASSLPTI